MKRKYKGIGVLAFAAGSFLPGATAQAADQNAAVSNEGTARKPNIILIVSDDTGYGDLGVYGGGEGRGMPTPNLDRMADEGMTFFDFYGQPSSTPGRAAMQTGRIPNRSGMTTVAFQGQGGGLPKRSGRWPPCLKPGDIKRSLPVSGTSARQIMRCQTPRAMTK